MARILLIVLFILCGDFTFANSCCGQSPASFTILSLNQTLSFSTGFSYLESQGRVYEDSQKFFIWENKKREVRLVSFNLASSFAEQQQVFINTNLLQGHYKDAQEDSYATNLSDTLLGYSYEILPEYSFSYWKPVIFLTALVNIPTGHSIYDKNKLSEGADVSGHNQWGFGIGLTIRKVYFPWTLTIQTKTMTLFSKNFERVKVSDFYTRSLALLLNYSSRLWGLQFNTGLTFTHLSERTIQPIDVQSEVTQNFSVLAGVQKAITESWTAGISYSDQTLVGNAKNSILNRSLNINFNYNYF